MQICWTIFGMINIYSHDVNSNTACIWEMYVTASSDSKMLYILKVQGTRSFALMSQQCEITTQMYQ